MNPGCMSDHQLNVLQTALNGVGSDPSLLSDLEGCGMVGKLESRFAGFCGRRFAVAVSSGTAAIHTALLACGIGAGDEVIVTPYSWPQSVSPVLFTGATPVFADMDPDTLLMDPVSVRQRISRKTKAIVPVHLFGNTANMSALRKISDDAGLYLIADAAHALGAEVIGLPVGALGDAACFSFSRGKLVCGGEGGILVTDDETVYLKAVALSQHPERFRRLTMSWAGPEPWALNYRIHPLAALLADAGMDDMAQRLDHRRRVHRALTDELKGCSVLACPHFPDSQHGASYGIPLIYKGNRERCELVIRAQNLGIPLRTGPVDVPLHLRNGKISGGNYLGFSQGEGACPNAEFHCRQRELWALSTLDMDILSETDARDMGRTISVLADAVS